MNLPSAVRPAPGEYLDYYGRYIARVEEHEALAALERQGESMMSFLATLSEAQGTLRYAPGKWSVKQVIGHVSDTERIFAYRALRLARADDTPLAGFDENHYAVSGNFDRPSLAELVDQLGILRGSTLSLFRGFEDAAWTRRGEANGSPVTVRALAFIIAGHGHHHMGVLKERYLGAQQMTATRP